ncbi:hypothetical protein LCGC14_0441970 [marine sediment metagenome]|uniref:Uncharacterized protein n=1 Tax=marine sediment metagenome TaxID=412755 RepID=A0A0F9VUD7_9ZZZZ
MDKSENTFFIGFYIGMMALSIISILINWKVYLAMLIVSSLAATAHIIYAIEKWGSQNTGRSS